VYTQRGRWWDAKLQESRGVRLQKINGSKSCEIMAGEKNAYLWTSYIREKRGGVGNGL